MTIERKSADTVFAATREDAERFLDSDLLIRQGMCPNGCGLMQSWDEGQTCHHCWFRTNAMPEREATN